MPGPTTLPFLMDVVMKYGDGAIGLRVPAAHCAWVRGLGSRPGGTDAGDEATLAAAIAELEVAGMPAAVRGRRVGLLLADGTREWSPEESLPPLWEPLRGAESITAFLCTGTHDAHTPENRDLAARIRATVAGAPACAELVVNDCRRDAYVELGTTGRGTPIEVHARALDCDVFLVVADMKHHYFAGFSNPTKYYVPGLASLETARANHSLALDRGATTGHHPWHPDDARRENPLAEDLVEAFERVVLGREHFALVQVSTHERLLWAGGGRTREVTARGIAVVERVAGVRVEPVRFLVVSPGGAPHDESLYTAQRALELSRAAVRDGGEVLLLARCPNGIGPPGARENFFDPLKGDRAELARGRSKPYVMYAHKPVKLARYLARLERLHLVSDLPATELRAAGFHPAASAQAILDGWVDRSAGGAAVDGIGLVDDASKLALSAG